MTTRRQALKLLTSAAVGSLAGCSEQNNMNETTETDSAWPPDVKQFTQETEMGDLAGDDYENLWYNHATAAHVELLYQEQQRTNELLQEIRDELKDGQS